MAPGGERESRLQFPPLELSLDPGLPAMSLPLGGEAHFAIFYLSAGIVMLNHLLKQQLALFRKPVSLSA